MTTQPWPALDALEAREERQLCCGVAAHERLLKERDELRVVLDDLLQERNWAHRIGALQQAERELRFVTLDIDFRRNTGLVSARTVASAQRALGLLSEALRGLPAHPAPEPQPPQISRPEARPAPQEAIVPTAFDVLTAFARSMEAFQTQRAGTEAEPEAEVGAGAEARPTTDSTHE